jgi:hypothetical protein
MAIAGSKRYMMPYGFNQLLLASGQKVTDKNIVELARALVVLALGDQRMFGNPIFGGPQGDELLAYPQTAFLDARRVRQELSRITYDAKLKVRIGEQVEEWYFASWRGQLGLVSRGTADGKLIMQYDIPRAESPLQRGQLDPVPDMVGETFANGDAQLERDTRGTGPASGSEPEEGQKVTVSLRRLSASEVMGILHKFPEMVASYLAYLKGSEALASVYPLSEVTAAPLKRAFPNVRFFKGLDFGIHPPIPYVMATAGRKRYPMPSGLNQLLADSDVRVTDANLVEIAKAAVILALGADMVGSPRHTGYVSDELLAFPKITSLSAEMQVTGESHAAKLTVRIGDSEESWYVHRWHDRLGWVSRGNANGLIKDYDMPEAQPREQQK